MSNDLEEAFPRLGAFLQTSDPTETYNCHAWAADENNCWWEPADRPPGWPRWRRIYWPTSHGAQLHDPSLENYKRAFGSRGFVDCADGTAEDGIEKIAIYVKQGEVMHTARQLPSGTWTSKLGTDLDIEHQSPQRLEGPTYGQVAAYMQRPRQAKNTPSGGTAVFP